MASRRPTDSPRTPAPATSTTSADSPASATKPTTRKPRAKKVAAPKVQVPVEISGEVRRGMIAEAAYLRAERRGFTGGYDQEKEDWLLAEAEVDALLEAGHGSPAQ